MVGTDRGLHSSPWRDAAKASRWQWESTNPGTRVIPAQSIDRAPGPANPDIRGLEPTAVMDSPATATAWA